MTMNSLLLDSFPVTVKSHVKEKGWFSLTAKGTMHHDWGILVTGDWSSWLYDLISQHLVIWPRQPGVLSSEGKLLQSAFSLRSLHDTPRELFHPQWASLPTIKVLLLRHAQRAVFRCFQILSDWLYSLVPLVDMFFFWWITIAWGPMVSNEFLSSMV